MPDSDPRPEEGDRVLHGGHSQPRIGITIVSGDLPTSPESHGVFIGPLVQLGLMRVDVLGWSDAAAEVATSLADEGPVRLHSESDVAVMRGLQRPRGIRITWTHLVSVAGRHARE